MLTAHFDQMHAVIALLEPNEGVRKQAVMRAQRAAGDAAAKAEQAQRHVWKVSGLSSWQRRSSLPWPPGGGRARLVAARRTQDAPLRHSRPNGRLLCACGREAWPKSPIMRRSNCQEHRRDQELQMRRAELQLRMRRADSKAKGKATAQRGGSAGGRGKGKVVSQTVPRSGAANEMSHNEAEEAVQPKRLRRSASSASGPDVTTLGDGGSEREAVAPAAETRRSKGRREAETRLKEALEPLATVRPLTAADAAQVEAALRACRESGVPPAVTAKVSRVSKRVSTDE